MWICKNCQAENGDATSACITCGERRPAGGGAQTPPSVFHYNQPSAEERRESEPKQDELIVIRQSS